MNNRSLETEVNPNWPARILRCIQYLVELIVLSELLFAVGLISPPFSLDGMPQVAGLRASPLLLAVSLLTMIPLAFLAYRNFWIRQADRVPQEGLRRLTLAVGLIAVLLGAVAVSGVLLGKSPALLNASARIWTGATPYWEPASWLSLLLLVILARICRRPMVFYLAALGIFTIAYGGLFLEFVLPKIQYIRQSYNSGLPFPGKELLQPGFLVSTLFMPLRTVLGVLLPALAALYCIRRGFAWWKFLAGGLAAWLAADAILYARWPIPGGLQGWIGLALMGIFLFLLARLPGQRWGLERLTGLSLAPQPDSEPALDSRGGSAARILGHGLLVLLIALLAGFAVVGFYERKIIEQEQSAGLVRQSCSPALVNAYQIIKPVYENPGLPGAATDELRVLRDLGPVTRATMEEVKGLIDPALAEKEIQAMEPKFAQLVRASRADCYCRLEEHRLPGFVMFVREFMARATWRFLQGRRAEALGDMEALLRLPAMMSADPNATVVQHLIAVVMRTRALDTARNYFLYFREDPAALNELKTMLERNARLVHIEFPAQSFARASFALTPVVPYFEMIVPKFSGRGEAFYQPWRDYDYLVIALALESYRREHGAYPGHLEALVPGCLERLPREPLLGKPYVYENLGHDFRLGDPTITNPAERARSWFPGASAPEAVQNTVELMSNYKASKAHPAGSAAR